MVSVYALADQSMNRPPLQARPDRIEATGMPIDPCDSASKAPSAGAHPAPAHVQTQISKVSTPAGQKALVCEPLNAAGILKHSSRVDAELFHAGDQSGSRYS